MNKDMESPWTQPGMRMLLGRLIQPTFPRKMLYREALREIWMLITRVNVTGSALVYSNYLGGSK
ncbi:MAG: hypothetical protein U0586_09375 [Candidatus Brocadiaceae bacterium]